MQCATVDGITDCYLPCASDQITSVCLIAQSASYEVHGTCKKSDDGKHLVLKRSGDKVECSLTQNQVCLSGKCTNISDRIADLKCKTSERTDLCLDNRTMLKCSLNNTEWSAEACNDSETCVVDWRGYGQCAKKCDAALEGNQMTYCAQKHQTNTMSVHSYNDQCDEIDGEYYWLQEYSVSDNYCSSHDCDTVSGECKPEISAYDAPTEKCTELNATRKICNIAYDYYSGHSDENDYYFSNNIYKTQSITQTCKTYNNSENYWMFESTDVEECVYGCNENTGECLN